MVFRLGQSKLDYWCRCRFIVDFDYLLWTDIGFVSPVACLSHQFDHSLSNDLYGSDTVLYELAIFSGRMNMEDIQKMEHQLMQKHGIIAHS